MSRYKIAEDGGSAALADLAKVTKTAPQGSARPAGGSNAGGGAAASKVDDKQEQAVRAMQRALNSLAEVMNNTDKAKSIAQSLNNSKITADDVRKVGYSIKTSWGNVGSAIDGIWGSNTDKSLNVLKKFLVDAGIQDIIISVGKIYNKTESSEVIDAANANLEQINQLLMKMGQGSLGGSSQGSNVVYDKVPNNILSLPNGGDLFTKDGKAITRKDLQDPYYFVRWLQGVPGIKTAGCKTTIPVQKDKGVTVKKDYTSVAKIIIDSAIVKIAAADKPIPPAPDEPKPASCLCIDTVGEVLDILYIRARNLSEYLSENVNKKRHPLDETRLISQNDVKFAEEYEAAVDKLLKDWGSMRDELLNFMSKSGMKGAACISPELILKFFRDSRRGSARREDGKNRRRRRGGAGRSEDGGDIGRDNTKPPFGLSYIDFDDLFDQGYTANNWPQFQQNWKFRQIQFRGDLSGSHWRDFARRHLKDEAKAEDPNYVRTQLNVLRNLMFSIYQNWKDGTGEERPAVGEGRKQAEILRSWDSMIQNLANNTQA